VSDRFARIPERVKLKRQRRELSFAEHAVLVSIVEDADYRTGEVVGTIRALADAWGWEMTPRHLRRVLLALRDEHHEIEFDVDERQRGPWRIRVVGDGFGLPVRTRLGHDWDIERGVYVPVSGTSPGANGAANRVVVPVPEPGDWDTDSSPDTDIDLDKNHHQGAVSEEKETRPAVAFLLAVLDEKNRRELRPALESYSDLPDWAFEEARDAIVAADPPPKRPVAYVLSVLRRIRTEEQRANPPVRELPNLDENGEEIPF
jgi:hypothetical protein